jgi:hypothetical protein
LFSVIFTPAAAKGAAETGCLQVKEREKHPSGAKAQHVLSATYGTTEVVPYYKAHSCHRLFTFGFHSARGAKVERVSAAAHICDAALRFRSICADEF